MATRTYTGAVSGDMNVAGNWSAAPVNGDDIVFPDPTSVTHPPTTPFSSAKSFASMIVNGKSDDSNFTIDLANVTTSLNVKINSDGNVTVQHGTLSAYSVNPVSGNGVVFLSDWTCSGDINLATADVETNSAGVTINAAKTLTVGFCEGIAHTVTAGTGTLAIDITGGNDVLFTSAADGINITVGASAGHSAGCNSASLHCASLVLANSARADSFTLATTGATLTAGNSCVLSTVTIPATAGAVVLGNDVTLQSCTMQKAFSGGSRCKLLAGNSLEANATFSGNLNIGGGHTQTVGAITLTAAVIRASNFTMLTGTIVCSGLFVMSQFALDGSGETSNTIRCAVNSSGNVAILDNSTSDSDVDGAVFTATASNLSLIVDPTTTGTYTSTGFNAHGGGTGRSMGIGI